MPAKGKKKRTPLQIQADREKISELHLRRYSSREIAIIVKQSHAQVCKEIKAVTEEWKKRTSLDIETVKQEELIRLQSVERAAWDAWEKSKTKRTKKGTKLRTGGEHGSSNEESLTTENLLGSPEFLNIVKGCVQERNKMLGNYAPVKQEHSGRVGLDVEAVILEIPRNGTEPDTQRAATHLSSEPGPAN